MRTFIVGIFFLLFRFGHLLAQSDNHGEGAPVSISAFYIDALSFKSDGLPGARIDIYTEVPFDILQFAATDSGFVARYEITVDILNEDGNGVLEKIWNKAICIRSFDETQSRREFSPAMGSITLAPGVYEMRAELREMESGKTFAQVRKLNVPDYSEYPFSLSDIMLVDRVTTKGGQSTIVPNVSGNLYDLPHGFSLFFEIYNSTDADSVILTYQVVDKKEKQFYSKSDHRRLDGRKTEVIVEMDSTRFPSGGYVVAIGAQTINAADSARVYSAQKRRAFVMRWRSMPTTLVDIDLAIRQAKYIANAKEYDAMADASTLEEKQKLFQEFWRKRNPSPDSQRNERMDEYYSRVQYANEHFSHFIEGWRTDMGMVFIIFGAPSSIDRHPFDTDAKPYVVWTYYDLDRQIVFVDDTGFGDYRLVTPIWDLVERANNR